VDCNPDRLDDVNHLAQTPFHDVHARIEGNAVRDLALTFETRWARDGGGAPLAFSAPAVDNALAPGGDIVQIARTYFAPAPGANARQLAFAPDGDRTIADTMIAAIVAAKEFIYIEDQYLTPPQEYIDALTAKVAGREIRQLIIAVPGLTDQPFGVTRRSALVTDLITADAGAGMVRVGYPRRRFTSTDNERRASSGKLLLGTDLAAGGGALATIFLGPPARLPALPFWVSVEGELIWVYDEAVAIPNPDAATMKAFYAERGDNTRLVRGDDSTGGGTTARAHARGAPATVVALSDIYVHAKMMIVDDVFLGLGSANLNHRGLFYDGEVNCFTIPDGLRPSVRNPALALRRQLWAEMLDLPAGMAAPLLSDPLAAARLFDRSPFAGNRFVPLDAQPAKLMLSYAPGDGAFMDVLTGLGFVIEALNVDPLFNNVVDPSSRISTQ
jgi:phosphatidylserine/phosphatidylglycerophosphate/cardiolipin synthase-like enzyme